MSTDTVCTDNASYYRSRI